jgi:hypothetical protein
MKHILLKNSFSYKKRKQIEEPKGYIFNQNMGAWIHEISSSLLVMSKEFTALGTKKEDIETGEDQKGE